MVYEISRPIESDLGHKNFDLLNECYNGFKN